MPSRKNLFYSILISLFLLTGCAGVQQFVPFPDQSVKVENPNFSRFYVLRPTAFGSAIKIDIYDNIGHIGKTGPNSFLSWEREPGDITITGEAENDSNLLINSEAGEVYYVQQHIRMGIMGPRNWLEQLSEEEGKKFLKKAKAPKVKIKRIINGVDNVVV